MPTSASEDPEVVQKRRRAFSSGLALASGSRDPNHWPLPLVSSVRGSQIRARWRAVLRVPAERLVSQPPPKPPLGVVLVRPYHVVSAAAARKHADHGFLGSKSDCVDMFSDAAHRSRSGCSERHLSSATSRRCHADDLDALLLVVGGRGRRHQLQQYHSAENKFERFSGFFLELISRFEFGFCRCENYVFLTSRIFGVFKVQSHTTCPYMCLSCGLLTPTQFHFECCGFRDDSW